MIFGEIIYWFKLVYIFFIEFFFLKCFIIDEVMNKLFLNKRVIEMVFCYCLIFENIKSLFKIVF